jgi:uncharacterized protein (TIGR00369 family)
MRDLDRYLGDGGMPVLTALGISFIEYGAGWSTATWTVAEPCANPAGTVQAGIHATALDAAMYFALVAALESGERGATLHLSVQTQRPAVVGDELRLHGQTVRVGHTVAFCSGTVTRGDEIIATATGTFAVQRSED